MDARDTSTVISSAPAEDRESARWLKELTGPRREEAVERLRGWLLGIARAEVNRRRAGLGFGGPELDDIAEQAASDATVAVLGKLDQFRGESRFTTWAAKFAILEVSNKVGRNLWRKRGVHLDSDAWEQMPDRFGLGVGREVESRELLAALRVAVETQLSARQRRIFEAIVLDEVPLDVLVIELDSNRNAIYKALFDARRKLRAELVANGYLDP
ncbi:MAG TPA: sigma-70 family RNA polymerase sigma factor [Solirubrobacterales bacterium]